MSRYKHPLTDVIIDYFYSTENNTTADICREFGVSPWTARNIIMKTFKDKNK